MTTQGYINITSSFEIWPWLVYSAQTQHSNLPVCLWKLNLAGISQLHRWSDDQIKQYVKDCKSSVIMSKSLSHANVLKVYEVFDSGNGVSFSSEFVECPLSQRAPYSLDESLYICSQIGSFLYYCHNEASLAYLGMCPNNIVIGNQFVIKVCNFMFVASCVSANSPVVPAICPLNGSPFDISLSFLSPEQVMKGTISCSSDVFQFGLMALLLITNLPPITAQSQVQYDPKQAIQAAQSVNIPSDISVLLQKCLAIKAEERPTIRSIIIEECLFSLKVKVLNFLSLIMNKTESERSSFYNGLIGVVNEFSPRIVCMKILPTLMSEVIKGSLIPNILPIMFKAASTIHFEQFKSIVLIPMMESQHSVECLKVILLNVSQFLDFVPLNERIDTILSLSNSGLKSNVPQIHAKSVELFATLLNTPEMIGSIDRVSQWFTEAITSCDNIQIGIILVQMASNYYKSVTINSSLYPVLSSIALLWGKFPEQLLGNSILSFLNSFQIDINSSFVPVSHLVTTLLGKPDLSQDFQASLFAFMDKLLNDLKKTRIVEKKTIQSHSQPSDPFASESSFVFDDKPNPFLMEGPRKRGQSVRVNTTNDIPYIPDPNRSSLRGRGNSFSKNNEIPTPIQKDPFATQIPMVFPKNK